MVVAIDGGALTRHGREVVLAGAEVDRRAERRVVDVLHVAPAVGITVDRHHRPRGREELHGTDGAVVATVVVEPPGVGVPDQGRAVPAVQPGSEDRGVVHALGVEAAATEPAVVGLDPPDGGQERPVEPAGMVGGVDHDRGALVGHQCDRRDLLDVDQRGRRRPARDRGRGLGGPGVRPGQVRTRSAGRRACPEPVPHPERRRARRRPGQATPRRGPRPARPRARR